MNKRSLSSEKTKKFSMHRNSNSSVKRKGVHGKKPLRVKITIIENWKGYKGGIDWRTLKQAIKETHEENYDENLIIESVKVEKL